MRKYLLLRDNKQTGPHSYDEILAIGFKKYDLVWVEGRSAAWRYPGELDEFKEYAPLVEEQPFDRFLRKKRDRFEDVGLRVEENPVVKSSEQAAQGLTSSLKPFGEEQKATGLEQQHKPELPKPARKYVAVSLPTGSKPSPLQRSIEPIPVAKTKEPVSVSKTSEQEQAKAIKQQQTVHAEKITVAPVPSGHLAYAGGQKAEEHRRTDLVNTWSPPANPPSPALVGQSAPPISQPAAPIIQPSATGFDPNNFLQYVAVAAGLASLLFIGILIGRSFDEPPPQLTPVVSSESLRIKELKEKLNLTTPVDNPSQDLSAVPVFNTLSKQEPQEVVRPGRDERAAIRPSSPKNIDESAAVPPERDAVALPPAKVDVEKVQPQTDLVNAVDVQLNAYKVKPFGGIEDIEVTIENHSTQALREVVVELRYILSNGKHLAENIRFSNVDPGGRVTLAAPASNRGIKLESRVVSAR